MSQTELVASFRQTQQLLHRTKVYATHGIPGFCRKIRFLGKIQKSGVRNAMTYRLPNSRKSNFATEPAGGGSSLLTCTFFA